jgi:hypothetical protein
VASRLDPPASPVALCRDGGASIFSLISAIDCAADAINKVISFK